MKIQAIGARRVVNGAKQIKGIVKGEEVLISPLCLCFFFFPFCMYMQEL